MQLTRGLANAFVILTICFLVLPLVIIIPISFGSAQYIEFPPRGFSLQWYERYVTDFIWVRATFLSLKVAALCSVIATTVGFIAALIIVRSGRFTAAFMENYFTAPMIVPSVVFAVACYWVFSTLGLIGSTLGIALAHSVISVPLVLIIMTEGLSRFNVEIEQAAIGLGASRLRALLTITVPTLRGSMLASLGIAFLTSFDEVIIAIFISGAIPTLPKKMYDNLRVDIDPTIAAVSTIEITFLILVTLLVVATYRRRAISKG
jgi:putative spermidine/putrescine transport system permease protein